MIFVTVGNMDPFDRLITAIDRWIADHPGIEDVFAQIGRGIYRPQNCKHVSFLTPTEFREKFAEARLVVSHAGMGTIITSLELRKPIVVMPKLASLGEQRNEHQLATVRHFRKSQQIRVAENELDLGGVLNQVLQELPPSNSVANSKMESTWPADPELIRFVHDFIS